MSRNVDILNELQELNSCLASMPWQMPYALPKHYFADLATVIGDGVHFSQLEGDVLQAIPKELPFDVNPTYLFMLAKNLSAVASASNLEPDIQKPFAVPTGYLEKLPETLVETVRLGIRPVGKPKTIRFGPHFVRAGRIAAAAVIALGIGFGTYRYLHPASAEQIAAKQLSKLDGDIVDAYVEQHVDEFDGEALETTVASSHAELPASISALDAVEIEEYLQESGEILPPATGNKTL